MNAAVITETRYFNKQIIWDHLCMLPNDFELIAFCGDNIRLFNEFDCTKYKVTINNLHDYNRLLTSVQFWEKLYDYDRVLIFQTDSKILREGIEEFYPYDFIGAPIKKIPTAMNGGLSLRNPKAMIEVIKHKSWNIGLGYEDIYFCHELKTLGYNLPDNEIAKTFSVETIFNLGSFGIHAANKYLSKREYDKILNQYNGKEIESYCQ